MDNLDATIATDGDDNDRSKKASGKPPANDQTQVDAGPPAPFVPDTIAGVELERRSSGGTSFETPAEPAVRDLATGEFTIPARQAPAVQDELATGEFTIPVRKAVGPSRGAQTPASSKPVDEFATGEFTIPAKNDVPADLSTGEFTIPGSVQSVGSASHGSHDLATGEFTIPAKQMANDDFATGEFTVPGVGQQSAADLATGEFTVPGSVRSSGSTSQSSHDFATGEFTSPGGAAAFAKIPSPPPGGRITAEKTQPPTNHGAPKAASGPRVAPTEGLSRYSLQRELARGGLGCVWLATDKFLAREVAVKDLLPRALNSPSLVERFYLEAQVTGQLEHPGIVPIYELSVKPDGTPYYSMKLLRGRSYREAIHAYHALPAKDPAKASTFTELLSVFVDVCNAMGFAHSKGVIHRDLKPHNVMLGEFGEAIVVDWGLAKIVGRPDIAHDDSDVTPSTDGSQSAVHKTLSASGAVRTTYRTETSETQAGSTMGTPSYMSPEQANGEIEKLDARSDIFALGTILFEVLTGTPPYVADNVLLILDKAAKGEYPPVRSVKADVPPALAAICEKSMTVDPAGRYPTAKELGAEITRWLTGEPVQAFPETFIDRAFRWLNKHRTEVLSTAAAVIFVAAVYGLWSASEAQRIGKLRSDAQALYVEGQSKFSEGDYDQASSLLAQAVAKIANESSLADLRAGAGKLLSDSDAKRKAIAEEKATQENLAKFDRFRDDALFHYTMAAGEDPKTSMRHAQLAARSALEVFDVSEKTSGPPKMDEKHTSPAQRSAIEADCYELLLALMEITRVLDDGDSPSQRSEAALKIADRCSRLGMPTTRAFHFMKADCLRQAGDVAGADEEIAKAPPPSSPVDFFLLARAEYQSGKVLAALENFDRVLRLDPSNFWAHYFVSVCQLKLGKPEVAVTNLTALLNRRPEFPWLHLLRGTCYSQLGDFRTADNDFAAALRLNPKEYAAFTNRAAARITEKKPDEAIADLKTAIALRPDRAVAYIALAQALAQQKRFDEALAQLALAEQREPTMHEIFRVRGAIHRDRKQFAEAARDFNKSIALGSGGDAAAQDYFEVGSALRELKQPAAAVVAFEESLRRDPKNRETLRLKADALLALGRVGDANRELDAYIDDGADNVESLFQRAKVRATSGDIGGELADYSRVVQANPLDPIRSARRGWTLLNKANKLALADFDRAIAADPKDADLYAGRGYARALLGQYREASADAELAVRTGAGSDPRKQLAVGFNAACIYAQAVAQVTFATNDPAREDLRKEYQTRAVELLRQVVQSVPAPSRMLYFQQVVLADPALNPIRGLPEFSALVAEYSPKPKP